MATPVGITSIARRNISDFMRKGGHSGFTLVELLVVIAIIAVLATIVLARLGSVRDRGGISKVKAQLAQVRAASEIYYSTQAPPGYTASTMAAPASPCTGAMFIDNASGMLQLTGSATSWPTGTLLSCQATASTYAVSASLPGGGFWCVDSSGKSQSALANLGVGVVACP